MFRIVQPTTTDRDPDACLAADGASATTARPVRKTAEVLWAATGSAYSYAAAAYELVRDTIPQSADFGDPRVSWRASDVLATRKGSAHLAFPVRPELGEADHPELHAAPHPAVLTALRGSADRPQLWRNLPEAL